MPAHRSVVVLDLFEAHFEDVYRYLRRLRDPASAERIAAEVFAALFEEPQRDDLAPSVRELIRDARRRAGLPDRRFFEADAAGRRAGDDRPRRPAAPGDRHARPRRAAGSHGFASDPDRDRGTTGDSPITARWSSYR